jgi:hypothetical protein
MSSDPTQDILNTPSLWPASFPKPDAGTRVLTYVFEPNDASKVQLFLDFIQTTFPSALVSVVKDSKGFTSVSITQHSPEDATADIADNGAINPLPNNPCDKGICLPK